VTRKLSPAELPTSNGRHGKDGPLSRPRGRPECPSCWYLLPRPTIPPARATQSLLATAAHTTPPALPDRELMAKQGSGGTPRTAITNVRVSYHKIFRDRKLEKLTGVCPSQPLSLKSEVICGTKYHRVSRYRRTEQETTSSGGPTWSLSTRLPSGTEDAHILMRAVEPVFPTKGSDNSNEPLCNHID